MHNRPVVNSIVPEDMSFQIVKIILHLLLFFNYNLCSNSNRRPPGDCHHTADNLLILPVNDDLIKLRIIHISIFHFLKIVTLRKTLCRFVDQISKNIIVRRIIAL